MEEEDDDDGRPQTSEDVFKMAAARARGKEQEEAVDRMTQPTSSVFALAGDLTSSVTGGDGGGGGGGGGSVGGKGRIFSVDGDAVDADDPVSTMLQV